MTSIYNLGLGIDAFHEKYPEQNHPENASDLWQQTQKAGNCAVKSCKIIERLTLGNQAYKVINRDRQVLSFFALEAQQKPTDQSFDQFSPFSIHASETMDAIRKKIANKSFKPKDAKEKEYYNVEFKIINIPEDKAIKTLIKMDESTALRYFSKRDFTEACKAYYGLLGGARLEVSNQLTEELGCYPEQALALQRVCMDLKMVVPRGFQGKEIHYIENLFKKFTQDSFLAAVKQKQAESSVQESIPDSLIIKLFEWMTSQCRQHGWLQRSSPMPEHLS